MRFYFAEIKKDKIFALHESTSLDLTFKDSDGVLIALDEQEYRILHACNGDVEQGMNLLDNICVKMEKRLDEHGFE